MADIDPDTLLIELGIIRHWLAEWFRVAASAFWRARLKRTMTRNIELCSR